LGDDFAFAARLFTDAEHLQRVLDPLDERVLLLDFVPFVFGLPLVLLP
jgi:hypothetical protein